MRYVYWGSTKTRYWFGLHMQYMYRPSRVVARLSPALRYIHTSQGMRIRLRIRTDDLLGFRKMLSIREVLFHELAHNVYR